MKSLSDYVVFNDKKLARRYAHKRIPMATLYEAYIDGAIDIPGDIYALLKDRDLFVKYTLTPKHLKWAVTNFIPEIAIHSKAQDERIVREHYDRGNDFFGWFLGERMVYTSGFFHEPRHRDARAGSRQQAEPRLPEAPARGRAPSPRYRLWLGHPRVPRRPLLWRGRATGVTISAEPGSVRQRARPSVGRRRPGADPLLRLSRHPEDSKFDKIISRASRWSSYVGVKNLAVACSSTSRSTTCSTDDGLFLLQWTGLRRGLRPEDLIWGLFMNKYIFPGADASLCPSPMIKHMEKAGFEMHSAENVTIHYSWTIKRWHDNWLSSNKAATILSRSTASAGSASGTCSSPGRRSSRSRATPPASRSC